MSFFLRAQLNPKFFDALQMLLLGTFRILNLDGDSLLRLVLSFLFSGGTIAMLFQLRFRCGAQSFELRQACGGGIDARLQLSSGAFVCLLLFAQTRFNFRNFLELFLLSPAQFFDLALERRDLSGALLSCGFGLRFQRGEFCQPISFMLGAQVRLDLSFEMSLFGGFESLTDLSNAFAEFSLGVVVILDRGIEV